VIFVTIAQLWSCDGAVMKSMITELGQCLSDTKAVIYPSASHCLQVFCFSEFTNYKNQTQIFSIAINS